MTRLGFGKPADNALFDQEARHWSGMRPMSRRLMWLTLAFGAACSLWVRRYTYGIQSDWLLPQSWFPAGLGPPLRDWARDPIRLWLAEPRLMLGVIAAMWCIEDAWRQRTSGQLDQIALTRLSGREILEAKVASLGRWLLPALLFFAWLQFLDAFMLTWFDHLRDARLGAFEAVAAPLRLFEQGLFFLAAAALAWRQILVGDDPFAMLRRSTLQMIGLCAGAQIWYTVTWQVTRAVFDALETGWLGTASLDTGVWEIATREVLFLGGLIVVWLALKEELLRRMGVRFHELYAQRGGFGE